MRAEKGCWQGAYRTVVVQFCTFTASIKHAIFLWQRLPDSSWFFTKFVEVLEFCVEVCVEYYLVELCGWNCASQRCYTHAQRQPRSVLSNSNPFFLGKVQRSNWR